MFPIDRCFFSGKPEVLAFLIQNIRVPALFRAVCLNQVDEVKKIMSQKADVDELVGNGKTALFASVWFGRLDLFVALIQDPKLNVNRQIPVYGTVLYVACLWGRTEFVKILVSDPRTEINSDFDNKTPLRVACEKKQLAIVTLLLSHPKIDVNKSSPIQAAISSGSIEIVEALLATSERVVLSFYPYHSAPDPSTKIGKLLQRYLGNPDLVRLEVQMNSRYATLNNQFVSQEKETKMLKQQLLDQTNEQKDQVRALSVTLETLQATLKEVEEKQKQMEEESKKLEEALGSALLVSDSSPRHEHGRKRPSVLVLGPHVGSLETVHSFEKYKIVCSHLFRTLAESNELTPEILYSPFKSELTAFISVHRPSFVMFAGCADYSGNWILYDGPFGMKDLEPLVRGSPLLVYSLCCFSQRWVSQIPGLTVVPSSLTEKPFSRDLKFVEQIYATFSTKEKNNLAGKMASVLAKPENSNSMTFNSPPPGTEIPLLYELEVSLIQCVPYPIRLQQLEADKARYMQMPYDKTKNMLYPRGFPDLANFQACFKPLLSHFRTLDPNGSIVVHGSSIQGYRFHDKQGKGLWFDSESDYDVALCGQALFEKARSKQVRFRDPGTHTEPIGSDTEWKDIADCYTVINNAPLPVENGKKRVVNFMLFNSVANAVRRHTGLSLVVDFEMGEIITKLEGQQLPFLKETKV